MAMDTSRRDFIKTAALTTGALALGMAPSSHPLRILILGGTSLIGPNLIRYALERGHEITIFTRGRTQPTVHRDLLKYVEHRIGDREDDLAALETGTWDAVIDNSGYKEEWTATTAALLKDRVGTYMYTSSTGVYYPYVGTNIGEETELNTVVGENDDGSFAYGVMKTFSERRARAEFGDSRTIVVRPTYIIGPGDRMDRFTYWLARIPRGGEVMIPGKPDDAVQYIDVRDLTEFMIRLLEQEASGTYNVVGPESYMGVHEFVHGVRAAIGGQMSWVPVTDYDFLSEHGVQVVIPWIMPVGHEAGSMRVNFQRAVAAGLTHRAPAISTLDTLAWWNSDAVDAERRENVASGPNGLMAREAGIIAAWRSR